MNQNGNATIEIDLLAILETIVKKAWLIILLMIICGIGAFAYAYYTIAPTYQSTALFYVNNNNVSGINSSKLSISSGDLTTSKDLVATYIVILKTRNTLDEVIDEAGLDMTYSQLSGKISASAVNETEVFNVTVTDTDPMRAELIANTIADVFPSKISSIVEGSSARVVDYAVIPTSKSGPSLTKYATYGLIIGAVIAILIIIAGMLMDYQIHNEDYLLSTYEDIPLLGIIPDFDKKRGYRKYGKGYKKYGYNKQGYSKYGKGYDNYYYEASKPEKKA